MMPRVEFVCELSIIMDGVNMAPLGEPKRRLPFKQKIKQARTIQYNPVDICTLRVINPVFQSDDDPHRFHIVDHRLLLLFRRLTFFVSSKYRLLLNSWIPVSLFKPHERTPNMAILQVRVPIPRLQRMYSFH